VVIVKWCGGEGSPEAVASDEPRLVYGVDYSDSFNPTQLSSLAHLLRDREAVTNLMHTKAVSSHWILFPSLLSENILYVSIVCNVLREYRSRFHVVFSQLAVIADLRMASG
jgi:hypothetical protein